MACRMHRQKYLYILICYIIMFISILDILQPEHTQCCSPTLGWCLGAHSTSNLIVKCFFGYLFVPYHQQNINMHGNRWLHNINMADVQVWSKLQNMKSRVLPSKAYARVLQVANWFNIALTNCQYHDKEKNKTNLSASWSQYHHRTI